MKIISMMQIPEPCKRVPGEKDRSSCKSRGSCQRWCYRHGRRIRGFVPASRLSLSYIEDLETYLLKDIEVQVIDVDQANNRLVLSARELLKEKEKKAP